jgi:hypothetical protein
MWHVRLGCALASHNVVPCNISTSLQTHIVPGYCFISVQFLAKQPGVLSANITARVSKRGGSVFGPWHLELQCNWSASNRLRKFVSCFVWIGMSSLLRLDLAVWSETQRSEHLLLST